MTDAFSTDHPTTLPRASVRRAVPIALAHHGEAMFSVFDGLIDGRDDHLSITFRGGDNKKPPLVRMHSECLTVHSSMDACFESVGAA